ncbi:hypothetical protein N0V95_003868 [Ascochyta clinopodiicola]|nr:hypothetical protein N0V95_003868 [Ascochyta clinopodiicola]
MKALVSTVPRCWSRKERADGRGGEWVADFCAGAGLEVDGVRLGGGEEEKEQGQEQKEEQNGEQKEEQEEEQEQEDQDQEHEQSEDRKEGQKDKAPQSPLTPPSSPPPPEHLQSPELPLCPEPPPLHFLDLPLELRERIYAHALNTHTTIQPHLCDRAPTNSPPKFHDANSIFHNHISSFLGLTRVSRKIRSESLPVFYEQNLFAVGSDTLTYFAYLAHLGRLGNVRRVELRIEFQGDKYAAWVLWCVDQTDVEVEECEEERREAALRDRTRWMRRRVFCTAEELRAHPRYRVGGVGGLNLALVLRLLSTSMSPDASCIVLPVSDPVAFRAHPRLLWFRALVKGLGLELRFAARPGTPMHTGEVEWQRRFQGQEYAERTVAATSGVADRRVLKRALEIYPGLHKMPRPDTTCYYRVSCRSGEVTWYNMDTLGGGQM